MQDFWQQTGRIFNTQRFSTHDGPGVRTIIFLKGCFLRCRWCCNPESQRYDIETLVQNGKETVCGKDVTVKEMMDIILQDMPYYRRSGGGVTLSGGESLAQPDFAEALLKACKEMNIHTAIETTAYADYAVIERLLPYLDLILMDIKHLDSDKHQQYTTKGNGLILENAKRLAKDAKELIIRVPVIPTFNDTVEEISAIAQFTKRLGTVKELHLLPYHRLGQDKYKGLGREYTLEHITPPTDEHMEHLRKVAAQTGLTVEIGG